MMATLGVVISALSLLFIVPLAVGMVVVTIDMVWGTIEGTE